MFVNIQTQPDDVSCGPTCLKAIYDYYSNNQDLKTLMTEVKKSISGGTLAAYLGNHALNQGYDVDIYVYNLNIFDPSWFNKKSSKGYLINKLKEQLKYKSDKQRVVESSVAYIEFLENGGNIIYKNLTTTVLKNLFNQNTPIITGLSATYLYNTRREFEVNNTESIYDDIKGEPCGHFVVLTGYNAQHNRIVVADPHIENSLSHNNYYEVCVSRLINAIMLGVMTYDANLIVISPKK
tara:strand:- start:14104 stop:14814 length:711 start_codon:yes stop_codon:yes gene_type:complete